MPAQGYVRPLWPAQRCQHACRKRCRKWRSGIGRWESRISGLGRPATSGTTRGGSSQHRNHCRVRVVSTWAGASMESPGLIRKLDARCCSRPTPARSCWSLAEGALSMRRGYSGAGSASRRPSRPRSGGVVRLCARSIRRGQSPARAPLSVRAAPQSRRGEHRGS